MGSGAGLGVNRQDLYRLHIARARDARAVVSFQGSPPGGAFVARWLADGRRMWVTYVAPVEGEAAEPGSAVLQRRGLAAVRLDLPTGVHRFQALLEPQGAGTWEAFPSGPIAVEQRRRHIRVAVEWPLWFGPPGAERSWQGVARDLSVGGIGFEASVPPPAGRPVVLLVEGEPGRRLGPLPARVVRTLATGTGYRCGAEFLNLGEATRQELTRLVLELYDTARERQAQA